ncbi:MAG: hypothetical protein Q9160_009133 [Pyrenula sp. 1 TL-2023]
MSVDSLHGGSGDGASDGLYSGNEKASDSTHLPDSDSIQDKSLSRAILSDDLGKNEILPQPKIGWKTPITILFPYLLSSQALAQLFNIIILISLGTAYAQCLWRIVRKYYIQTDTLDKLFTMKSDPLALFDAMVDRHAWRHWSLMLLSITILGTQIAVIFPVGAITTQPMAHNITMERTELPTFNAADLGDGGYESINKRSLILFTPCSDNSSQSRAWLYKAQTSDPYPSNPSLTRVAQRTMMDKVAAPLDVPRGCRSNCSYGIEFDGPFIQCNAVTKDRTLQVNMTDGEPNTAYWGAWTNSPPERLSEEDKDNPNSVAHMDFKTRVLNRLRYINANMDYELHLTETNTSCTPMKATYHVNNTWINSTHFPSVQISDIRPLINVAMDVPWSTDDIIERNNTKIVDYIRDSNVLSIIQAMLVPLQGSYSAGIGPTNDTAAKDVELGSWQDASWQIGPAGKVSDAKLGKYSHPNKEFSAPLSPAKPTTNASPPPGTSSGLIVDYTPLFTLFNQSNTISRYLPTKTPFLISPTLLNSFLQNTTLSVVSAFQLSTTNVSHATSSPYLMTFVFSNKPSLIIPYFITLAAALPFVVLSLYALWENGAAAGDGNFLQVVLAAQGGGRLGRLARRDAARGVGAEGAARELKKLRVRFGVVAAAEEEEEEKNDEGEESGGDGPDKGLVIAGFGTEKEIVGELGRDHDHGRPTRRKGWKKGSGRESGKGRRQWTLLEQGEGAEKKKGWQALDDGA